MQNLRNLADAIRRNAHSDNIRTKAAVIRTDGSELSWTELDEQVDYCARGLRELTGSSTSTPAARVAIALPNSVEFVVAYFAALRAGLVAMPINPTYTGRELRQLLDDAGAEILVASGEVLSELEEASYVDSCSDWQTFSRIVLPLMRVPLLVLAAITFNRQELQPGAVGIYSFIGTEIADWHRVMAFGPINFSTSGHPSSLSYD